MYMHYIVCNKKFILRLTAFCQSVDSKSACYMQEFSKFNIKRVLPTPKDWKPS